KSTEEQCEKEDSLDEDKEDAESDESDNEKSEDKKDEKASDKKPSLMAAKATSTSYKKGDRSSKIASAKKKLNKIGFGGITVTNYFGNFTEKRVKQFQKEYVIKQTGKLNKTTLNKI